MKTDTINFFDNYFSLIAAGARLKLIEPMFHLDLFALFDTHPIVLERDIIEQLCLMPLRAQKWLHLLSCEHFLIKTTLNNQTAYQLPDEFIELKRSDAWWEMKLFFNSWRVASEENLSDVLRFGKVKTSVSWPPKKDVEVDWLEQWMANTANKPVDCILEQIDFKEVKQVLDVGGGDGTVACALAKAHPHIHVSVYNLPRSAAKARKNCESQGLHERVRVIEGDFIAEDSFPKGFDLILFTRVLFDWDEKTDRKLLQMAYQALTTNGLVAICEYYKDKSNDRCIASEYRYIFHDDFAVNVFKTRGTYQQMLEEIGFTLMPDKETKLMNAYHELLLAKK